MQAVVIIEANKMLTRKPVVAGQFYPAQYDGCVDEINEYLEEVPANKELPDTIAAGIVPHAGWTFSAALAAAVFSAIKQQHEKVHTFVIFGAAHSYFGNSPAVCDKGHWVTPLGEVAVNEELAEVIVKSGQAVSDSGAHRNEHSIEVQVPFIQYLFGGAKIVPIIVPPSRGAITLGQAVGNIISKQDKKIVCIGSTDLTHYGPHYGFEPMGTGADAIRWASKVNDKQFIDLALRLEPEQMLASAAENGNACGAGAAAAAVAAAKKLGKTKGLLLAQANSSEIMLRKMHSETSDSVGYAAIVF